MVKTKKESTKLSNKLQSKNLQRECVYIIISLQNQKKNERKEF